MNFRHGFSSEFSMVRNFWLRHENNVYFYPALLGILCAFALLVLLIPGIPIGHDIFFHLRRIEDIADGLRAGNFPVRIHSGLASTGYANGLFYPDIFLYFPSLLVLIGVPLLTAYKLFIFAIYFLSAGAMYWSVLRIGKERFTAFAAALLYMYSSYAACDFWIRAALGEIQCFVFLPFILYGLYEIIFADYRNFWPLAIGMAGLAMAHVITFMLATIFCGVLCAFFMFRFLREFPRIVGLCAAAAVALLLSCWFLLPLLEMMRSDTFYVSTFVSMTPISARAVPPLHLILELPYMKLKYWHPAGIGVIFAVILFCRLKAKFPDSPFRRWQDAMLTAGAVLLLCSTPFLPWEGMFSALSTIQFPWRLYLLALACLSCGGAMAVNSLCNGDRAARFRWLIGLLIGCGIAYFLSVGYIYTTKLVEKNMYHGEKPPAQSSVSSAHYLPDGTDMQALEKTDRTAAEILAGNPQLNPLTRHGLSAQMHFSNAGGGAVVEFPLIAYKGYRAEMDDGTELSWYQDSSKKIAVELPPGCDSGTVRVYYRGTALQFITGWISFSVLIALILIRMIKRKGALKRL